MLRFVLVALCLALSSALTLSRPELDSEWGLFKEAYNKLYSPSESLKRRAIWEYNLQYIESHNLQADRGLYRFWLGMNEYGDLSIDEFVSKMNGYKMTNKTSNGAAFMPPSHIGALPDSVDWRKEGYVTDVKNQGQCGSCWAFSTTGSLEGQHFKQSQELTSLSEQNLVDCSRKQGNMGCQGGLMDQAFRYIKQNKGVDTEDSYPYIGVNEKCRFKRADVGAADIGYTDIKSGSEADLQSAVSTVGPISVAIDAGHRSFQLYKRGVYHSKLCSSTQLDHGVLAVGYGTYQKKQFWLVKNSWGTSWGIDGYIMMSRNKRNNCGIATQASFPIV